MQELNDKLFELVHQNPNDLDQIRNRAMLLAGMPVFIGFAFGPIIIGIMSMFGY